MPLSAAQQSVADDDTRFRVVIAGRRFGKTHLAIRELAYHARIPERNVWYIAPTYKQAKNIVWRKLRDRMMDLKWVSKPNESELRLDLVNGSNICLKGADNYDSLRGVGNHFLVLDEFADIDPAAWYETLRPTLSDTGGSALFIGTPKGIGNWSYDIYQQAQQWPDDWRSFQFTTLQGGRVSPEEIAAAQRDLDARTFRQEYEATFETYGNRIFYAFDPVHNTKAYTGDLPRSIMIGMDFNVDPMTAVVAIRSGELCYVIDEIVMYSSNTNEMVSEIQTRYPGRHITVYPDPASRQRKTSAGGATDLTILQNAGFTVKAPHAHNPVRDGINSVNSRLCSASGERRLFIDPACRKTIDALNKFSYKEGTSQPDKDSGYDHISDALRYLIDYVWPVKRDVDPDLLTPQRWGHAVRTS